MSKSKRRRTRSAAQIRKILTELKESGLPHHEFAAGHNIPLSTLSSWLGKQRRAATTDNSPEVIPVGTVCEPPPPLEIEFPGGEILRIGSGCQSRDLRCVLAELRRC